MPMMMMANTNNNEAIYVTHIPGKDVSTQFIIILKIIKNHTDIHNTQVSQVCSLGVRMRLQFI
jgi:hypothetical protein